MSRLSKVIGPGLLFAGAAVGVSHLVQSTRAGADFGLGLLGVLVLANIVKYPAFSFGPRYAAATGTSLLEGYRRQGRWALWLYLAVTVGTMFTVQAAVTFVTAGLAKVVLHLPGSPLLISVALTAVCMTLLLIGHYPWLDAIMKVVVAVLTVSTLLATVLVLGDIPWRTARLVPGGGMDRAALLWLAAFVGWMPSAIDIAVWHSLWTNARRDQTGVRATVRESKLDFDVGYVGTAILAFCFLALGAVLMFGSPVAPAKTAVAFAGQIVDLYAQSLGDWSRPVIGLAAFLVMFSTTLTVVDGVPRALAHLAARFGGPEPEVPERLGRSYWMAMAVLGAGAMGVVAWLLTSLTVLVDVATTLSCLTAPVLAFLNHRAVTGSEVHRDDQPGPTLRAFSLACVAALAAFALWYLWLRFVA